MDTKPIMGTGRRKSSVARVYAKPGTGTIVINGRAINEYFVDKDLVTLVQQPLDVTDSVSKFDFTISVMGGGITGQAGAVRLGIARALVVYDGTNLQTLRRNGFMTRDPRMVERKKYGRPGARKRFQFSKR